MRKKKTVRPDPGKLHVPKECEKKTVRPNTGRKGTAIKKRYGEIGNSTVFWGFLTVHSKHRHTRSRRAAERTARNAGENAVQHRDSCRRPPRGSKGSRPCGPPVLLRHVRYRAGAGMRIGPALPVGPVHGVSAGGEVVGGAAPCTTVERHATLPTTAERTAVQHTMQGCTHRRGAHLSAAHIAKLYAPPPSTPQRCTHCQAVHRIVARLPSCAHRRQHARHRPQRCTARHMAPALLA
eukprot:gene23539-biopygen8876